jgi:hypothetical protein
MTELVCWNCGTDLDDVPRPISRHANCPRCYEVLHCCRMCRHHVASIPGECDHDEADPPVHKESANFCSYFKPRFRAFEEKEARRKDGAKSRADALFGEDAERDHPGPADPSSDEDEIRSRLDDLFDD